MINRLGKPFLFAFCLLLAACASRGGDVRSEAPTLQLEGLGLDGGLVRLVLLVHNPNDHGLVLQGVSLGMRVEGSELFVDDWPLDLEIGPRVNERVRIESRADPGPARRLLERARERDDNIGYTLELEMRIQGQKDWRGERTGFLHPVPGQPGQFR